MNKNLLAFAALATVLTGCASPDGRNAVQAHAPAHSPTHSPTPARTTVRASELSDPLESPLPLGTVILAHHGGSGPGTLDLSRMPHSAKAIQLHWICVGPGKFEISDGTRTIVGSECDKNAAEASDIFGGKVPRKAGTGPDWKIKTNSRTVWRISATTAG